METLPKLHVFAPRLPEPAVAVPAVPNTIAVAARVTIILFMLFRPVHSECLTGNRRMDLERLRKGEQKANDGLTAPRSLSVTGWRCLRRTITGGGGWFAAGFRILLMSRANASQLGVGLAAGSSYLPERRHASGTLSAVRAQKIDDRDGSSLSDGACGNRHRSIAATDGPNRNQDVKSRALRLEDAESRQQDSGRLGSSITPGTRRVVGRGMVPESFFV